MDKREGDNELCLRHWDQFNRSGCGFFPFSSFTIFTGSDDYLNSGGAASWKIYEKINISIQVWLLYAYGDMSSRYPFRKQWPQSLGHCQQISISYHLLQNLLQMKKSIWLEGIPLLGWSTFNNFVVWRPSHFCLTYDNHHDPF